MRGGFSLIELVIGLLLLQVGVLAAAGLTVRAQAVVRNAEGSERIDWIVRTLADSLAGSDASGSGEVTVRGVRLRWWSAGGHALLHAEGAEGGPAAVFRLPLEP